MSEFEDLQSQWQQQERVQPSPPDGAAHIRAEVARLRAGFKWTIIILTLTFGVLAVFFYVTGALSTPGYLLPVSLMLGALFFRILAEVLGRYRLRRISPGRDLADYRSRLSRYYNARQWIHFLLTPLVLTAYSWGFILLLPTFKAQLSAGFYTYILVSGGMVLLAIIWLVVRSIREELRILNSLREEA